jgi:hypothetical protein
VKYLLLYKLKIKIVKLLSRFWYWMLTPLSWYYSTEKINKRYDKKKNKITEDQAVKWISEDIVRYLIKNKKSNIELIIADYADSDYFNSGVSFNGIAPYYIKRDKSKMAYYKFDRKKISLTNKVLIALTKYDEITIQDWELEKYEIVSYTRGFIKAVIIKYQNKK